MAISVRHSALDLRIRRWFEGMARTNQSIFPWIHKYNLSHESGEFHVLTFSIMLTPELLDEFLGMADDSIHNE
jgi:hypothetical protein